MIEEVKSETPAPQLKPGDEGEGGVILRSVLIQNSDCTLTVELDPADNAGPFLVLYGSGSELLWMFSLSGAKELAQKVEAALEYIRNSKSLSTFEPVRAWKS